MKQETKTTVLIIGLVLLMAGCVVFGVVFEILKFGAVVKWIFT